MQFEISSAYHISATKLLATYSDVFKKYSYDISDDVIYLSIDSLEQLTEFINDIGFSVVINKLDLNDEYGICIYDGYLE